MYSVFLLIFIILNFLLLFADCNFITMLHEDRFLSICSGSFSLLLNTVLYIHLMLSVVNAAFASST